MTKNQQGATQADVLQIMHNIQQLLPYNPQMGRPGRIPGPRELIIPKTPFIVPFDCSEMSFKFLRVYHGAQRWPQSR